MQYESKNNRINVKGTTDEIRNIVRLISDEIDKGISYQMIREDMERLEKIVDPAQYTFGIYHRIYYNRNSFLYVPNVSGKQATEFHYNIFKKFFDKAIEKLEHDKQ